jgi:hypothetical protein
MRSREKRGEPSKAHPDMSNAEWLKRHSRDIVRRYPNQWVAVYHQSVVAHGPHAELVRQNASAIVGHSRFLMKYVEKGLVIL